MSKFHKQMTPLEVYTAYYNAAKSGDFPCIGDTGRCRYRANGKACAIGVFLPDSVAVHLDTTTSGSIGEVYTYDRCQPFLPKWMSQSLAVKLQTAHDMLAVHLANKVSSAFEFYIKKIRDLLCPEPSTCLD